jgi:hypothetical protein
VITSFTKETCEQLKYYVYRLIDPRNGLTFYVGKGKGNRVFAHVNCALKDYKGENYIKKDEADENLKIQLIKDINDNGLEVMHIIHRFGMDQKTAYEVEGALIDAYPSLTNLANGHHNSDNGISNVEEIHNRFSKTEYVDSLDNPRYIIIKTTKWRLDDLEGSYAERLYFATRHCWKISPRNAKKHPYVLSVIDGVVKEVYKVEKWNLVNDGRGRYEFEGQVAEPEIRNIFLEHRIPQKYRKRGQASPVLYSKV